MDIPIDNLKGKGEFNLLAHTLLDKRNPHIYNQAIMDFGATICTPKKPLCIKCLLNKKCLALEKNSVTERPVKTKKLLLKNRRLIYIVFNYQQSIFIRVRKEKDIWENLYEFYLLNTPLKEFLLTLNKYTKTTNRLIKYKKTFKQKLTHQNLEIIFYSCEIPLNNLDFLDKTITIVPISELSLYPFPKSLKLFITKEILPNF